MVLQFNGEGPNVGKKCIFVRVIGCDFHCAWCDSKFAWTTDDDTEYYTDVDLASELIQRCEDTFTSQVILTGGNPCLYNFEKIIKLLHNHNIMVDVETQGSIFPEWLNSVDTLVISPKAPSSKQKDVFNNVKDWIEHNSTNTIIKIPIFNEEDFKFAEKYYKLVNNIWFCKLYLSVGNDNTTESGDISKRILGKYKELIERTCKSEMSNVYILPQVHTLVWR